MIRRALALAALVLLCTVAARAADPAAYLRVRTLYPTAQLRVWSSDDGKAWNPVCTSAPFAAKEGAGGEHPDYLFALDYLPAYLRFGVEGAFLGRLSVDFAEVLVGDGPRAPKELTPVGTVLDPDNLRARDDRPAILIHRGQPEVVDGFVLRLDPTPKPPSHAAKRTYWGNYVGPRDAGDELAQAIAWWDFTIFQQGAKLEECVRRVKALNPRHRVVLRLWLPGQSPLLYAYDEDSRRAARSVVVAQFVDFANLVDTVTLSEEEPGNTMRGLMFGDLTPEAVYLWKDEFERETGQRFVWRSPAVMDWMGEKFHFMLNDLYDYLHKRFPRIKVYQWVELRDYRNISGFPQFVRGEDLKMDGYVLEWMSVYPETLVETPLGPAAVRRSFFEGYLQNLMERNRLKPEQILGQVWPFTGDEQDLWQSVEGIKVTGVPYIYNFWPNAGMPELPATYGSPAENTPEVQKIWKDMQARIEAERKGSL